MFLSQDELGAFRCIAVLEGQAEAYACRDVGVSDLTMGFVSPVVANRLVDQGLVEPWLDLEPLRLTPVGQLFYQIDRIDDGG